MRMARSQATATAAAIRNNVVNQPRNTVVTRITLRPYEREARARVDDIKSKLFGLRNSYTEYGSTDGEWRKVRTNTRRWIPPPGCLPRRSKRLQAARTE
jgi:heptaprenylglyceryl phosphate synthase